MPYIITLAKSEGGVRREWTLPHLYSMVSVKKILPGSEAARIGEQPPGTYLELVRPVPCTHRCEAPDEFSEDGMCGALAESARKECIKCGAGSDSFAALGEPGEALRYEEVSVPGTADEIYQMNEKRETLAIHRHKKEFRA